MTADDIIGSIVLASDGTNVYDVPGTKFLFFKVGTCIAQLGLDTTKYPGNGFKVTDYRIFKGALSFVFGSELWLQGDFGVKDDGSPYSGWVQWYLPPNDFISWTDDAGDDLNQWAVDWIRNNGLFPTTTDTTVPDSKIQLDSTAKFLQGLGTTLTWAFYIAVVLLVLSVANKLGLFSKKGKK